jgi:chromosome partitioning protein
LPGDYAGDEFFLKNRRHDAAATSSREKKSPVNSHVIAADISRALFTGAFGVAFREQKLSKQGGKGGRMFVLVVASQKGGSGKTTLSGHLAVEAQKSGMGPVALIDTDPQGSLSQWWDSREETTPFFVTAGLLNLGEAVERLRGGGVSLVVIDTPPAITVSIAQAIAHADLVLLPTRPSPHDLRALGATVDIAERHEKPLIFVINGATPRARITGEAAIALSQHGTVAPTTIHHRVDFAASMVDGRTVGEIIPNSASAKEIRELWKYVQDRLGRVKKDTKAVPSFMPSKAALSLDEERIAGSGQEASEIARTPARDATVEADIFDAGEGDGGIVPWRNGTHDIVAVTAATPSGLHSFGRRRAERHAHSR